MAQAVDTEARIDSQKGLFVVSILAILASTSYFFYTFVDKKFSFFYGKRRFMIFTLTAGDLFLALFSLIVFTRRTYEKRYRPGCSTGMCAKVYFESFFPFVYAIGLVVLSIEMVFRQKIQAFFPKREYGSIAVAGLPWVIALIFILPLTLAGMDWDECRFESGSNTVERQRAIIWLSVVLPAVAAVVSCAVVKHIKFSVTPKGRFPGFQEPIAQPHSQPATAPFQSQPELPPQSQPEAKVDIDQSEPNVYSYGSEPSQPNPQPAVLEPNQPATSWGAPHQPPTGYSNDNLPADAIVMTPDQVQASVDNEKKCNLIVALIFFSLSIPFALFKLGYSLNGDADQLKPVPEAVLTDLFLWLFILRSVVTPLVWAKLSPLDIW